MNRWSRTVGDKHYNRVLAYDACHLERLLTDARHNFVDRPIELLRHQSAGRSNRCMKPVQSLFSLVSQRPRYYRLAASPLSSHAHSHACMFTCFAFFPTDFRGKETARSLIKSAWWNRNLFTTFTKTLQ